MNIEDVKQLNFKLGDSSGYSF